MIEIREYLDGLGRSLYARWFDRLAAQAAAKVAVAVVRMERGNFSNAKAVGGGVHEIRIDFGPGYERSVLEFKPLAIIHTCHSRERFEI